MREIRVRFGIRDERREEESLLRLILLSGGERMTPLSPFHSRRIRKES